MTSLLRSFLPRAAAALLLGALCASGAAQDTAAPGERPAALDERLWARVNDPAAEPVDVFLLLRDQPAADVARAVRPAYEARVDAVWRPVREALRRIDTLLPERSERARLSVGRQIAIEDELLRPDERETRRAARREVARLLAEMRATILAEAWVRCEPTQSRIAAHVADLPDGRVLVRTAVLNALVVRLRPADLPTLLATHPEIVRVEPSGERSATMDVSAPVIGADDWTSNGIDGSGQRVAIVDTGVDASHPALSHSDGSSVLVGSAVYLSSGAQESNFNDDDTTTDDLHGHGTHLAGTIASQDSTYGGVAPGTPVLNAKCFYRTTSGGGSGLDPDIIAATDWALTNGAAVLNLSFGGSAYTDGSEALSRFYDAVVAVTGASVAVAAGNSGSSASTVLSPGDAYNALTVGAFGDNGTTSLSDDYIAGFSSRGPCDDGRRKPDLAAPGVSIRSTSKSWEGSGADFVNMNGTSMATPHVAAAMALLLDHESSWQPEALKALMANSTRNTSPAPTSPDQAWGHGGLDLSRAYAERDRVETATLTSSGATALYFLLDDVASGDRATLVWNRSVAYASGGRSAGAGTARALVDLDLVLYDSDGGEHDASESAYDPIEQVKATSALGDTVLKVDRVGSFPSGQTSLDLAVASAADLVPATPPALSVALGGPAHVAGGAQVTLTATVTNGGGLPAVAPEIALTVPAGWSLVSGSTATRTLADLAASGETTLTWQVTAPSATGAGTFSAYAESACWGETFASSVVQTSVRADATPPTITAGPDVELYADSPLGRLLVLQATGSDDSGLPVTYAWDTDGDGDFGDDGGSAQGNGALVQLAHGAHAIGLRGVDHAGNVASDDVVITILDNPPHAVAGDDVQIVEGAELVVDATGSGDLEGPLAYAWDFGDGATGSGATARHAWGDQGVYTVTLTVTDSAGQTATDTLTVTVENADPVADAGPDLVADEGRAVTLLGSGSDPGISDTLTYAWTLGDGATASTADVSHVYREDGVYTATLTVTDDDGATATDTVVVEVRNLPPEVDAFQPLEIQEGATVLLTGHATDPGADDTISYRWTIEGVTFDGPEVSYTFQRDGNLRAYLAVTDDDGAVGYGSVFLQVHNVPPTLTLPAGAQVGIGSHLVLDLQPDDASALDRAALRVDWRIVESGVDGAPVVVATGSGATVDWAADRRLKAGLLEATVADDDAAVAYSVALRAVTPPVADTLAPLLALDLEPALEKKALAALFAAHDTARPGAKKAALRKALQSVKRARKALRDVAAPLLEVALGAIQEDLAAGFAPPAPDDLVAPGASGATDALLSALPGAGFEGSAARRMTRSLLRLRDAERRAKPEKKLLRLRAKAWKAATRLPPGAAATWFAASLAE